MVCSPTDSGAFYVAYKQMTIRALTVPLPLMTALGGSAVAVDCYAQWRDGADTSLWLGLAALATRSRQSADGQ